VKHISANVDWYHPNNYQPYPYNLIYSRWHKDNPKNLNTKSRRIGLMTRRDRLMRNSVSLAPLKFMEDVE
jgi:hypothetical protein